MKTTILKTSRLFLLLALLFSYQAEANPTKEDFSKPYEKSFTVTDNAKLSINTEFTNIKAVNWNKNEISVEVTVSVDAKDKNKAQDKFERVMVDISGNSNEVNVETSISSNFFGNSNNNQIEIEVLIYYPENIQLNIENEFGSCIFGNISGSVKADISYGDFRAQNLSHSDLDLEVEFGKIELERFQSGKVNVSYGGFTANAVSAIHLSSQFSNNRIEYVNHLELKSAYDELLFGEIDIAFMNTEFTSLRIDQLNKHLQLHTSYGSFNLRDIAPKFELIDIESEFTGVSLYFNKEVSFAFEAEIDMGDFKYPKELTHITFFEKDMMDLSLKGYIGNAKDQA
ncbi:MAG: hypothetical protein B7C24_04780, partial [Bacteroidetes bacterium 4572_77]